MKQEALNHPNNVLSHISFQQKSIGVSLVIVVSIAIYYFMKVVDLIQSDGALQTNTALPTGFWQLAITTLVLLIVVEATLQAVLAIGAGRVPNPAQRDHDVALKATRNGYTVLAVGVFMTFGSLFFTPTAFIMGNILLLVFVLAEITRFASQLIYYRQKA